MQKERGDLHQDAHQSASFFSHTHCTYLLGRYMYSVVVPHLGQCCRPKPLLLCKHTYTGKIYAVQPSLPYLQTSIYSQRQGSQSQLLSTSMLGSLLCLHQDDLSRRYSPTRPCQAAVFPRMASCDSHYQRSLKAPSPEPLPSLIFDNVLQAK